MCWHRIRDLHNREHLHTRVVVHHGQAALQKQGEWTDREREGSQVNDLLEAILALLRALLKAVTEKSDDALLDRAYGCFGFLGLVTMSFALPPYCHTLA